jgi:hypothetical protein
MAPLSGAVTIDRTAPTLDARVKPRRLSPRHRSAKIIVVATERSTVKVKIKRRSRLVKRFSRVVIAADEVARFAWRARTSSGDRVAPGRYRVVIMALDRAGNATRRSATIRVIRRG